MSNIEWILIIITIFLVNTAISIYSIKKTNP